MKNFKKILMLLVVVASVFTLAGCSNGKPSEAKNVDLAELNTKISEEYFSEYGSLTQPDAAYVEAWFNLSEEDYAQVAGVFPMISATALEVMMFEAKDGKLEAVKTAVDTRLDGVLNGFGYPSTIEAAENAVIFTEGNYVFLIMTNAGTDNVQDTVDLNNKIKASILEAFK